MTAVEHVAGGTFCLVTPSMRIPFYRLDGPDIVLLDSGLAAERAILERALEENGLRPRAVLTTHAHYDHIGNHGWLQSRYGARLYLSLFDAAVTQDPLTLQACFYTDRTDVLARVYPYMLLRPDHILTPGAARVQVEGAVFEILSLPGHAHSHLGFVTPDRVAYLGDLLLSEDAFQSMRLPFHQNWGRVLRSAAAVRDSRFAACILAHNAVCADVRPVAESNLERLRALSAGLLALVGTGCSQAELFARAAERFHIDLGSMRRVHIFDRIFFSMVTHLEESGLLEAAVDRGALRYRPTGGGFA